MWNKKDFDLFFVCLNIFHFHFFLRKQISPDAYHHHEELDDQRPYYILETLKHSNSSIGAKIIIKTFDNIQSFRDIDVIIQYNDQNDQNNKHEFTIFKDFVCI